MQRTKNIAIISLFTALLIGGQLALSAVSGIEIVTVLFFTFAYVFGVKRSLFVANAFTILRCLIFGFFPNVTVLYLVYYNMFAVVVGLIGKRFKRAYSIKKHLLLVCLALFLTASFTLLDNVITPLIYAYTPQASTAYWYASIYTLIPQLICTVATVSLLFYPLYSAFIKVDVKINEKPAQEKDVNDLQ